MPTDEQDKPLDQPKIYLNVLYHDKVLPPMTKQRKWADTKDDKDWAIIPISFAPSKERWSGTGMKCIHIDAHINTCVADMFRTGAKKIGAITNYILLKLQVILKDHYVLHKKSIKALKGKKYKAWRGPNDQATDYVLPESHHVDHHEKAMKKIKNKLKMMDPNFKFDEPPVEEKKEVKMPTASSMLQEKMQQEDDQGSSKIIIPGINEQKENVKKPVIVEMGSDKYKPNFTMKDLGGEVQFIFQVDDEPSAKTIQLDVSEDTIKLDSPNYELVENFKGFKVDESTVRAKFSKKQGSLTVTIQKI